MRHYQRGIATTIILSIFLISAVAIVSAYFIFQQNQQKFKSINSFEDCAKYYPVMKSYPAQCNTPDGKHFVQELSDEEKKKLVPPLQKPDLADETSNWKTYKNQTYKFSIKYSPSFAVVSNGDFGADFYNTNPGQQDISPGDIKMRILINQTNRNFNRFYSEPENTVIKEEQHAYNSKFTKLRNRNFGNFKAVEYVYEVPSDGVSTTGIIIDHAGDLIEISSWDKNLDNFTLALSTFKFLE